MTIKARANDSSIIGITASAKERLVGDELVANLFLRVSPKGKKSWIWTARVAGSTRKITLGQFPAFSLADARSWADERNAERARGHDPVRLIEEREAEAKKVAENTVEAVWKLYLEHKRHAKEALASLDSYDEMVRRDLLPLHRSKAITALTKADVRDVLKTMRGRGAAGGANRLLSIVKTWLRWCDEHDYVDGNVAASLSMTKGGGHRRELSIEEMATVWRTLGTGSFTDDERDAFRLILLTGCRRMESIGTLPASFRDGVWTISRNAAKNNLPCALPLGPEGQALFEARAGRSHVFHPAPHRYAFKDALDRLRSLVSAHGEPWEHWDIHSIRHGVRTMLTKRENGQRICDPDIAERIINHAKGGIDRRYDHNNYVEEKGEALARWEKRLLKEVARQAGAHPT